jgi:hypothetical protein
VVLPQPLRKYAQLCATVTLQQVRGDHCRTVCPQNHSNIMQFVQIFKGHILGTYCLEFILRIPIISILLVIHLILLLPDVSIFVATGKHFRISDMALLCEFMH